MAKYSDVELTESGDNDAFDDNDVDYDDSRIATSNDDYDNNKRSSRRGVNTLRSHCPKWQFLLFVILVIILGIIVTSKSKDKMKSLSSTRDNSNESSSSSSGGNGNNGGKESKILGIRAFSAGDESLLLCHPTIECMTDRWSFSDEKLFVGQSMCNDEFRFGVIREYGDFSTALVWQDCNTKEIIFLQNVTLSANIDEPSVAFQITENGTFELHEVRIKHGVEEPVSDEIASNNPLWTFDSALKDDITPTQKCLSNHPIKDCPYLHLRKHGGNIVLNYESKKNGWVAKGITKSYPNLFPDTFNP